MTALVEIRFWDRLSEDQRQGIEDRFWAKVDKGDTCWIWTASGNGNGHGQFGVAGALRLAHRVAYELVVGPIPYGYVIDHLCRNRACVNPDHLEAVTAAENTLRGNAPSAIHARKTHCHRGHPFSEENTYRPPDGSRVCRTCKRERYAQRSAA